MVKCFREGVATLNLSEPQTLINRLAFVCRTEYSGLGVINLLYVFNNSWHKYHANRLGCFVQLTGITPGAVMTRRIVAESYDHSDMMSCLSDDYFEDIKPELHQLPFEVGQIINKQLQTPLTLVLSNIKDSMNQLELFSQESELYKSHTYVQPLTDMTLSLFRGLFNELKTEALEKVYYDSTKGPIMQFILHQVSFYLGEARTSIKNASLFYQSIEPLHYHLVNLLELFYPFQRHDVSSCILNSLDSLPDSLSAGYLEAGLSQTALNVQAAIYNAFYPEVPKIAYADNSYFESQSMSNIIGIKRGKEEKPVDVYLCAFNHNCGYIPHYASPNIQLQVERMIRDGSDPLTVVVDCTIGSINSRQTHAFLKVFEKDIMAGRLNVIFHESGQKYLQPFDMVYAAPYVMINNGDRKWSRFKNLTSSECFTADMLSTQWFALLYKYGHKSVEQYKRQSFTTNKYGTELSKRFAQSRLPFLVSTMDDELDVAFVELMPQKKRPHDGVIYGYSNLIDGFLKNLNQSFSNEARYAGPLLSLHSFGRPYTTYCVIESESEVSIRLNFGINDKDVIPFIKALEHLAKISCQTELTVAKRIKPNPKEDSEEERLSENLDNPVLKDSMLEDILDIETSSFMFK